MYAFLLAVVFAAAVPGDAPFVVVTTGDDRATGKLVRLTPDFTATIATRTGEVDVPDAISLRRDVPLPPFPTKPHVVTANGDRIVGELLGGGGLSMRFVPSVAPLNEGDAWAVPLTSTAAIWFTEPPADTPVDPARYSWVEGTKNRDVFRFRNGDTARGTLVGLGPEADLPALQFRPETGAARAVAGKELAAVAFNPALVKPRKPKGPYARVVFADGSRIDVANPSVASGLLKGETLFGQKVSLTLDAVVAIDALQGKAVYLSDLKPKKAEQGGFLGVLRPWVADRGVDGAPLKLLVGGRESTFDKGLGTHPRTVLTYDLGGKYRHFDALVGLNPDAGDRGEVKVRVLVDGKPHAVGRAGGRPLTAGKPVAVKLDVSGARELVLEVDYGPTGSVEAGVNWADARLIASE
jgi:hypothetical protein